MAQCRNCKKLGFFFHVPKYGICIECLKMINLNFRLILPIIQELVDLAEKSDNAEDKIKHLDLAIQHITDLMEYERFGIFDLTEQLNQLTEKKQVLIDLKEFKRSRSL